MRMPVHLVTLLLALSLLVAASSAARACSCLPTPSFPEAFQGSDAIFLGEVIAVVSGPPESYPTAVSVEFRVDQSWKGDVPATTRLLTSSSSASCGYYFETGTRYLVYAIRREGAQGPELWTGLCGRTHGYWPEDPDLVALGRARMVQFRQPFPSPSSGDVTFEYTLGARGPVELAIYDIGGRQVRALFGPETQESGPHHVVWDGRDRDGRTARAGIYLAALTLEGQRYKRRFALMR